MDTKRRRLTRFLSTEKMSDNQQQSASSPSLIWFQLVGSDGKPFKETSADKVTFPTSADVSDFRKSVKNENPNMLSAVDASQLKVFKNKSAFDGKEEPLEEDFTVAGLGTSKKDALIVVVPSSSTFIQSTLESNLTTKEPHPTRKGRWSRINDVLEENKKRSKTNDSTAYSYVTWNQVKSIFNPTKYVQPRKHIDDAHLDFLLQYLSYVTKCFGGDVAGNEAKLIHFIAPVLICVCFLFDGDVEIVAEEDLVGKSVKAHGHFEFMMKRGNKAVCIVEAKKDDIEQGMAQDLVGCEVAAEVGGLDVVYGIVTNYIQWTFLRSLNEKVEKEICYLYFAEERTERDSLKIIIEKIYAMLSDE